MTLPIIGITTYNQENKYGYSIAALMHRYIEAVSEAGGVPVLIPSGLTGSALQVLLERMGGILFTGGGDIAPAVFGGQPHPRLKDVDPCRDALELPLARAAAESGRPFLGICRGFQVVTVALGGTLFTDIADQKPGAIKHAYDSATERMVLAHAVNVEPGSHLAEILGESVVQVNSLHHQGVQDIPAGVEAAAAAPDGLVEGLEIPGHPFGVAVQWHPEWLTDRPESRRLFRAFVEAAGR